MPEVKYFKPQGIKLNELEINESTYNKIECLRLNDIKELSLVESTEKIEIHQLTFQKI